jgi:hypothetical protein
MMISLGILSATLLLALLLSIRGARRTGGATSLEQWSVGNRGFGTMLVFMLLAGDRDVEAGAVSFRFADRSQINGVPREQAIAAIGNWIADRENAVPNADTMKVRGD